MSSTAVSAHGLSKVYSRGAQAVRVLDNVDLRVEKGELVAVAGPSGAGKTSLLYLLGGLARPTSGSVSVGGKALELLSDAEVSGLRNRFIGFVFQSHNLLPDLTAVENAAMPLRISGKSEAEAQGRAKQLLHEMGLSQRLHHKPGELSGGEQQRVAIARALACSPEVLLADEPTGNLDHANSKAVFQILYDAAKSRGVAVVMVTHNEELAKKADRVVRMQDGRIVK